MTSCPINRPYYECSATITSLPQLKQLTEEFKVECEAFYAEWQQTYGEPYPHTPYDWERWLARVERLHRDMQHDRAVLADAVEHRRVVALRDGLTHDVDGLGFEALQVRQPLR